jgi:DNA polymerase-1
MRKNQNCFMKKQKGFEFMAYVLTTSPEQIEPHLKALLTAKVMAVDTETTGLDPHANKIRLVQLALGDGTTLLIDCFTFLPDGLPMLAEILSSGAVKVFQNAKFDLQFFVKQGIDVHPPLFDTMLAAQLLRTSGGLDRVSLAELAHHYLLEELPKEEQKSDWSGVLRPEQLQYAARDAEILLKLRDAMTPLIWENSLQEVAQLEFACVRAVAQMEYHGIYLNLDMWNALLKKTDAELSAAQEALYVYTGRPMVQMSLLDEGLSLGQNLDSNKQIMSILHSNGIDVTDTTHHSLIPYINHPLVSALLEYRRTSKALSTFLIPLPDMVHARTGRLHPHYGQNGAWSGRMSSGGPNIQQIPRDAAFRACFTAPPGRKLVIADYSQIELRVAAEIAQDERMIAAYRANEDLHRLTASLISGKAISEITKQERQAAKAVNFGLIFAMGARGLQAYAQDIYGVEMTLEEAIQFRDRFFAAYAGIATWHKQLRNHPPRETRTLAGRKHIYVESSGLSGLTNTPVQGSAADIVKQALGLLVDALDSTDAFIVAMVHDEILIEANNENAEDIAALLKQTMETAGAHYLKSVPTVAEVQVADSWAEK